MSIIEKVIEKLDDEEKDSSSTAQPAENADVRNAVLAKEPESAPPVDESEDEVSKPVPDPANNIVELDFERLNRIGILTPDSQNLSLSEQFRRIKMPLLSNAFGDRSLGISNQNMIMVTSSLQDEGKSFTSFNLAMSVAKEFNYTVLYIDADLTQKMMEKMLDIGSRPGLVDYLLDGKYELSDLFLKTNVPRLTLLPAGRSYDRVTELWSSLRMGELTTELSTRYHDRLIVIDAPPLLQDSSASILANIVGQIIIVVEAEKTPRHIVEEAVSRLDESRYVGLVLNKSNQRDASDYGYYSGYEKK